ncbi:MAG: DNA alkylation repair protein [Burkholderiaceae bacterium]|nr:DNA alkylation repair protein [Burkholderiaceae bacterium]
MAEPFKHLLNAEGVAQAAAHLARASPGFDADGFVAQACKGLDALELKARVLQVADALEATLPADFDAAAGLIEAALAPARGAGATTGTGSRDDGLAGWFLWPVGEYVARRGQQRPARALAVLHALTQRFSAEFAIRPFIVHHPALSFATLQRWTADPSAQVRRLVSEGSRPRLPWGLRLQSLVADPSPTLPLLRALQDDPSEDVRRSVANHLNDIAKDHPALVAQWLATYLPGAPAPRIALLRHASRSLIKAGDPAVLAAWGLGAAFRGRAGLTVSPEQVRIGDELQLGVQLQSRARSAQRLAIDYAVHHVKAAGHTTPKVFKGWVIELAPGETRQLSRRHSMKAVTTRRYHPGRHALDLRINGQVVAEAGFTLAVD